jgi:hypothetical protein
MSGHPFLLSNLSLLTNHQSNALPIIYLFILQQQQQDTLLLIICWRSTYPLGVNLKYPQLFPINLLKGSMPFAPYRNWQVCMA